MKTYFPARLSVVRALALVVAIFVFPLVESVNATECNTYYNSRVSYIYGQYYCGATGGTCVECYNEPAQTTCYGDDGGGQGCNWWPDQQYP